VNDTNIFVFIESMPFGGVGSSGIGNYYGKYGFDSLTHAKSILVSPPDVAIDHVFPPYTMAEGEPKYDRLEKLLAEAPVVTVPTITMEGDANGAPHPDPKAYAKKFTGKYAHRNITGGVGHNLPQEAPVAFAKAVVDVDAFDRP
jgi:hypothetical protein